MQAACKHPASLLQAGTFTLQATKSYMAGVQVLVRFRVLTCPPKYPLYNIKKGNYKKKVAFWTCALHARPFLEFYRGPRAGGRSVRRRGAILAVPLIAHPVTHEWLNPMSRSNPLLPDSGWSEWYLTFAATVT